MPGLDESPGATFPGHVPALPRAYRLGVICLAALGFAYVWGMVSALAYILYRVIRFAFSTPDPLILLVMGSPIICAAVSMLVATARIARARVKPPEGIELIREDAPELFETLRLMEERLQGPVIGKIVLSKDFNVSIVRMPRCGLPFLRTSCLVLGLPVLQALSCHQMLSVIAHEYGYLSRLSGRLNPLVYRLRQEWIRILKESEGRRHWGRVVTGRFLRWYAPFFHSYTLPVAQAHELNADLCSVLLEGRTETAAALVRLDVLDRYLSERFWPIIRAMADTRPEPPESVYGLMQERLKDGIDGDRADEWAAKALSKEAGTGDMHACLGKRLSALNRAPAFHELSVRSAAQHFFPRLNDLRKFFDDAWSDSVREQWQERHAYVQKLKAGAAELVSKARLKNLNVREAWDLAILIEEISGSDRAFPFFERILKYRPGHAPALYAVGRIALAKGDESGAECIEKAVELDPACRLHGFELLYDYFREKGDREKAGRYYQLLSERKAMLERLGHGQKTDSRENRYPPLRAGKMHAIKA